MKQSVKKIDSAGQTIGLTGLTNNPEKLEKILDEAKTLGGQANIIANSLKVKRYIGMFALTLLVLLTITLLALLVLKLYSTQLSIKDSIDTVGKFFVALTGLLTLFGLGLGFFTRSRINLALDELQNHEKWFRILILGEEELRTYEITMAQHTNA